MANPEDFPTSTATPLDYAQPSTNVRPRQNRPRGGTFFLLALLLGFAVYLLWPATNKSRQVGRVACVANMRLIGESLAAYAERNGGRYPDSLDQLYVAGDVRDPRLFVCPVCEDTAVGGPTSQAAAAGLTAGGHLSYVYVGRGLTTAAHADTVVLFELASNHQGAGGNVLFADGHGEWFMAKDLRRIIDPAAAGVRPVVRPPDPPAASRPATTSGT